MERLHFLSGPLQGTIVDLTGREITIGRSPNNTICIDDESISEHHATITRHGQVFILQDAGSAKGVFVGSEKVVVATLKDDDRIAFGPVEAWFKTSAPKPPPLPKQVAAPTSARNAARPQPGTKILLAVVALLLVIAGGYGIFAKLTKTPTASRPAASSSLAQQPDPSVKDESRQLNPPPAGAYFKTHWQDESQFIVETIARDLAEMAFYAKHRKLPVLEEFSVAANEKPQSPFRAPIYEIQISLGKTLPTIKDELNVNGPIWSPAIYGALAKKLFAAVEIASSDRPAAGAQDDDLLSQLIELTARNVEVQNLAISKLLAERFCDATLHEKAAVILGAFMMREHALYFSDIRLPLCRMTAHLAMASRLANPSDYGINGQFAEAMLFSLMNNQKDALEKLAKLEGAPPALQPWIRALRVRNTYDYRLLAGDKRSTLLEKTELFRAACHCIDVQMSWDKLSDSDKRDVPDYCRIANEKNFSVETGHQLLANSLPLEFNEMGRIYSLSEVARLRKEQWVEVLNRMPERCFSTDGQARVRIIGWGQWAAFFQRHLCHALDHNFDFLKNKWGVPDEARKFSQQTEALFSGLRLYPFVRRFLCMDQESYHQAVDDGFAVTVATPHLVTPHVWNYLCYTVTFAPLYKPNPNPHINEWHKHNPPPGTAYDPLPRTNHPSLVHRADVVARMEELHAVAPYDKDIAFNLLRFKYKKHPPTHKWKRCITLSWNTTAPGYMNWRERSKTSPPNTRP